MSTGPAIQIDEHVCLVSIHSTSGAGVAQLGDVNEGRAHSRDALAPDVLQPRAASARGLCDSRAGRKLCTWVVSLSQGLGTQPLVLVQRVAEWGDARAVMRADQEKHLASDRRTCKVTCYVGNPQYGGSGRRWGERECGGERGARGGGGLRAELGANGESDARGQRIHRCLERE